MMRSGYSVSETMSTMALNSPESGRYLSKNPSKQSRSMNSFSSGSLPMSDELSPPSMTHFPPPSNADMVRMKSTSSMASQLSRTTANSSSASDNNLIHGKEEEKKDKSEEPEEPGKKKNIKVSINKYYHKCLQAINHLSLDSLFTKLQSLIKSIRISSCFSFYDDSCDDSVHYLLLYWDALCHSEYPGSLRLCSQV